MVNPPKSNTIKGRNGRQVLSESTNKQSRAKCPRPLVKRKSNAGKAENLAAFSMEEEANRNSSYINNEAPVVENATTD